ncbi:MAG: TVP38/TMEM64 family protein [Gemmataceae bacterium]
MRTLLYFVGFAVFGLVLLWLFGEQWVQKGGWLERHGKWAWVVAIGLLVADVFIPIPTTAVITSMGQQYEPFVGGLIGTFGMMTAGIVAYGLTRFLGRRFARWLLGNELERAEKFYLQNGMFAVACSRWLPLIPEAISCFAGLVRMPFGNYCLALFCGSVPMSFAYAGLAKLEMLTGSTTVPLVVSVLLPVPIWWIAGRLLHLRIQGSRSNSESSQERQLPS